VRCVYLFVLVVGGYCYVGVLCIGFFGGVDWGMVGFVLFAACYLCLVRVRWQRASGH